MSFQRSLRKLLWRIGYDVRRVERGTSELSILARQCAAHSIDCVFDVGAHTGQFARRLREAGFVGRIVSFEPSTDAHEILCQRAKRDTNWAIAPRMALGDRDGVITLNLAGNGASSSVLPMLTSHVNADPGSSYVGWEPTELHRLDSVFREFLGNSRSVFLKLDVQGFESKVLEGASEFLARVAGIQLELSFLPLYEGERLFHPMLNELEDMGYVMWGMSPAFSDPSTGRVLQIDAVFFRVNGDNAAQTTPLARAAEASRIPPSVARDRL